MRKQIADAHGRRRRALLAGLPVTLALLTGPAQAVPILDQMLDVFPINGGGAGFSVNQSQSVAQTFTVGVTGLLIRAEVQAVAVPLGFAWPTADLWLDVMSTDGGVPDVILGTASIPNADLMSMWGADSGYVGVDVSGLDINVTAGDLLAIALHSPPTGGGGFGWWYARGDPYTCGDSYAVGATPIPGWSTTTPASDVGFRTFVDGTGTGGGNCGFTNNDVPRDDPWPVPEPSSLALLVAGMIWLRKQPPRVCNHQLTELRHVHLVRAVGDSDVARVGEDLGVGVY